MTNIQSYEQRVSRLTDARRNDSAAKRAAVLKAIADLRREDDQHRDQSRDSGLEL